MLPVESVCNLLSVLQAEDRSKPPVEQSFEAHWENWKSAEDEPEVVAKLLQAEVDAGFAEVWTGTYDELAAEFQGNVAIGKLGVAYKARKRLLFAQLPPPVACPSC